MQILLVGGGGREHALAWKLGQSPQVAQIFVAPGNGGTARLPKTQNVAIDANDLHRLCAFAHQKEIELTIVGPEAPLVAGLVDRLQALGLCAFGPSQAAAQLEGSKAFSKAFMQRHAIPTGQAEIFTDYPTALHYLQTLTAPPVLKASGLAAGKGVVLPASLEEAADLLEEMLVQRRFGDASATVLIEERLTGPELSVLAFCDGQHASIMPPAQDHKRLLEGDQGPNTGGMGAFAPSPLATPALLDEVERRILQPTLSGMAAEGMPYVGVLYVGLMLTTAGPQVLEYNCRLGDPETQALLPLLESDLAELCLACVEGRLDQVKPRWANGAAATVVLAARGYPEIYATGKEIHGLEAAGRHGCTVFVAGAQQVEGRLLSSGGRVLNVTATGPDLTSALAGAYAGVTEIHFDGAVYRRDIGRLRI
jgi:phosphoribosylamine--glycine ligase